MATLRIKLKPGAKKDAVKAAAADDISIWVTSRPVEGKANAHLIKLLSKTLRVAQSSCTIVRGETSRTKTVTIDGISEAEVVEKLNTASKL